MLLCLDNGLCDCDLYKYECTVAFETHLTNYCKVIKIYWPFKPIHLWKADVCSTYGIDLFETFQK